MRPVQHVDEYLHVVTVGQPGQRQAARFDDLKKAGRLAPKMVGWTKGSSLRGLVTSRYSSTTLRAVSY